MRHLSITPILALLFFAACGGQQAPTPEPVVENPDPAHNSRNALAWAGTYSGTLPCADCEGIAQRLTIVENGTFTLNVKYLGRNEDAFSIEGTFVWEEDGNHIVLQSAGRPGVYQVGENHLWLRDPDGQPITNEMADRYVLTKEAPALPAATDVNKPALVGTNWNLVELMGKPVPPANKPRGEAHIFFDAEETRAYGNSGCNSFFGTYELEEAKVRLRVSKAGSTMMACPDMSVEDAFHKALAQVDNYTIGEDGRLSLNKAKMAPLMRFEAAEE